MSDRGHPTKPFNSQSPFPLKSRRTHRIGDSSDNISIRLPERSLNRVTELLSGDANKPVRRSADNGTIIIPFIEINRHARNRIICVPFISERIKCFVAAINWLARSEFVICNVQRIVVYTLLSFARQASSS